MKQYVDHVPEEAAKHQEVKHDEKEERSVIEPEVNLF